LTGIKSFLLAAVQHEIVMKPPQPATHDAPLRALEADINAVASTLFQRWPVLIGFSVRDGGRDDELHMDISTYPEPGCEERGVLLREIAQALAELMDEAPGAGPLLRARTFARTRH
jgi:hypothetical protein